MAAPRRGKLPLSMRQLKAEQRLILHHEFNLIRQEAYRKRQLQTQLAREKKATSQASSRQQQQLREIAQQEAKEEENERNSIALEMKRDLEYREKCKPIMMPLAKSRSEIVKDFESCSDFVFSLKDSVNPDRAELRRIKSRHTTKLKDTRTARGLSERLDTLAKTGKRQKPRGRVRGTPKPVDTRTLPPMSKHTPTSSGQPETHRTTTSHVTEHTDDADSDSSHSDDGEELSVGQQQRLKKLRAKVKAKDKQLIALEKRARTQEKRADAIYRRCVQLEREQGEWKSLYTQESSQRTRTAELEREQQRMLEEIAALKLARRRQDNAGSKAVGITGAGLHMETRYFTQMMSRLQQQTQKISVLAAECAKFEKLYAEEVRKNLLLTDQQPSELEKFRGMKNIPELADSTLQINQTATDIVEPVEQL